jgi:uncharacterized lipoprotein YddW (UPF0748 family)
LKLQSKPKLRPSFWPIVFATSAFAAVLMSTHFGLALHSAPATGHNSQKTKHVSINAMPLPPASSAQLPHIERSFRAAWIATVWNKDWPSRDNLSTSQQQAEAIAILDRAQKMNFNALIFQVRPMGDALFRSSEPWSQFLSGKVGGDPGYDPLAFWVQEAHKRGLELHAWFNPYRVGSTESSDYPANHISKTRPDYVVAYGKSLWLDPGKPEVNAYVRRVVTDVVRRYNIDGVHLDDYFYPYPQKDKDGLPILFADDVSYEQYRARGGAMSLADWRRDNVNALVKGLYNDIKALKPHVKFGISPFGIWRSGSPPGVRGLNAVDELYADSRLWLQQGWVDYLTPQLYWPIKAPAQSYPVLLRWWSEQNVHGRHLWPGHAAHRVGAAGYPASEIKEQIALTQAFAQEQSSPTTEGNVLFGWSSVMQDKEGIAKELAQVWARPALVPASPWLNNKTPATPRLESRWDAKSTNLHLTWKNNSGDQPFCWTLQFLTNGEWSTQILPGAQTKLSVAFAESSRPQMIALRAVSRTGVLSAPAVIRVTPAPASHSS